DQRLQAEGAGRGDGADRTALRAAAPRFAFLSLKNPRFCCRAREQWLLPNVGISLNRGEPREPSGWSDQAAVERPRGVRSEQEVAGRDRTAVRAVERAPQEPATGSADGPRRPPAAPAAHPRDRARLLA